MAWCHQATSHYLSQCGPSSMSPYGVTRPKWVTNLWTQDQIKLDLTSPTTFNAQPCSGKISLPEPILTKPYDITSPQWVKSYTFHPSHNQISINGAKIISTHVISTIFFSPHHWVSCHKGVTYHKHQGDLQLTTGGTTFSLLVSMATNVVDGWAIS